MREYKEDGSRILIYQSNSNHTGEIPPDMTLVTSPVSCLNEATENLYDLIVIMFDHMALRERDALVELCSALGTNHRTKQSPLLCILQTKHRALLERLRDAGVRYVMLAVSTILSLAIFSLRILKNRLEIFLLNPPEDCRIDRILSEICPNINYSPISHHQEILYCGAYRNRLVLGPYRLDHYCTISNYRNCEYFNSPRVHDSISKGNKSAPSHGETKKHVEYAHVSYPQKERFL